MDRRPTCDVAAMDAMERFKVGIIGGSGFYDLQDMEDKSEVDVKTDFGIPSDKIVHGKIGGVDCFVLARHGRGHTFNPSQVNYRANVRALQLCGVTHILAATACGSLKEDIKPGDLVLVDSFIDRTTKRDQTFHEMDSSTGGGFGTCCHIPMSPAFCLETRQALLKAAENNFASGVHFGGTVVAIEGPRFSSKAESRLYKSWGCDVINMTTVPEVVLAAEAGISYAAVAMVTDYDSWKEGDCVSVEKVLNVLSENVANVKKLFVETIKQMGETDWSSVIKRNKEKARGSVLK